MFVARAWWASDANTRVRKELLPTCCTLYFFNTCTYPKNPSNVTYWYPFYNVALCHIEYCDQRVDAFPSSSKYFKKVHFPKNISFLYFFLDFINFSYKPIHTFFLKNPKTNPTFAAFSIISVSDGVFIKIVTSRYIYIILFIMNCWNNI